MQSRLFYSKYVQEMARDVTFLMLRLCSDATCAQSVRFMLCVVYSQQVHWWHSADRLWVDRDLGKL